MSTDTRLLTTGSEIPTDCYSDQPYVVQTDDGAWLCTVTTSPGHEGHTGQHVISQRSLDRGRTWQDRVAIEAPSPEASYAVLLKVPGGRIYAFYNYNTLNQREVIADPAVFKGGLCRRVDSLGDYVYKYSDDHGRSWSERRWVVPMRLFAIDRENPYGGDVRFGWNVGKPVVLDGAVYLSFHKVGGFGHGFFVRSEGVLVRSDNMLTERDPDRIVWETLPDGDVGLRAPAGGGPVAEEQSYVALSDGTLYSVYRTTDGHPATSRSYDRGHSWTPPAWQCFADGRRMKHPRAANFAWKCTNGKYLYWFHNHGGRDYEDRNPAWLCGGVEVDGPDGRTIAWSQPEILLYDDDPYVRMSYPDLLQVGDQTYITETQKDSARVHTIDPSLLTGLWGQHDGSTPVPTDGVAVHDTMPALPRFTVRDSTRADYGTRSTRDSFSLDLTLRPAATAGSRDLLSTRDAEGAGIHIAIDGDRLAIYLGDGRTTSHWHSDPGTLTAGATQRITVIVDGGPRLILLVVDGRLQDGGEARQWGWGRFSPTLMHANGAAPLTRSAELTSLRVYTRALRVSDAIASQRQA